MGKLIPILLALLGLGAGVGVGIALRPAPEPAVTIDPCGDVAEPAADHAEAAADTGGHGAASEESGTDFVKLNNQFVLPVVKDGNVAALVVLSLSLEVVAGQTEAVYQREPKLRDMFLQVLFNHANAGGFDGAFTAGPKMDTLRQALFEAARGSLGNNVVDVLITDLARQDM